MPFSSDTYQLEKGKRCLSIFMLIIFSFSLKANAHFNGESPLQEEVSLTCTFGENINEKRQPFRILDDNSENALKCTWEKEKLYCSVGEGYSFDWKKSDKVTVRKSQGPKPSFCFCFLVNTTSERPCTVEGPVERSKSEKTETQTPELDEDFSPRKPSSEEFSQTDSHSKSHNVFVITGVALTVVSLGLFTAVIFIFIKWRRSRPSQKKDSNSNDRLIKTPSEDSSEDSPIQSV